RVSKYREKSLLRVLSYLLRLIRVIASGFFPLPTSSSLILAVNHKDWVRERGSGETEQGFIIPLESAGIMGLRSRPYHDEGCSRTMRLVPRLTEWRGKKQ